MNPQTGVAPTPRSRRGHTTNQETSMARRRQVDHWPPATPTPVAGCVTCDQLARQRAAAVRANDRSAVSDANVLLRKHAARQHS